MESSWNDYYDDYPNAFESDDEEHVKQSKKQWTSKTKELKSSSWSQIGSVVDVGFDADIYYEHLYKCFQDLQFNRVDLDDHFWPFLLLADQAFADGTIPDAAIFRL